VACNKTKPKVEVASLEEAVACNSKIKVEAASLAEVATLEVECSE